MDFDNGKYDSQLTMNALGTLMLRNGIVLKIFLPRMKDLSAEAFGCLHPANIGLICVGAAS